MNKLARRAPQGVLAAAWIIAAVAPSNAADTAPCPAVQPTALVVS